MGILVKEEHNGRKDVERGRRIDANARLYLRLFNHALDRVSRRTRHCGPARRGPRTPAELAGICGVLEHRLYRMLRALAGDGVFAEDNDGRFALTPMAELLRSDNPRSLRDWAISRLGGGGLCWCPQERRNKGSDPIHTTAHS